MTLLISGSIAIDSILVSILTFLKVRDLRQFIFNHLILKVDLDFQGRTIFFQICIMFKVNHHSYIICFRFAEFLDHDYVEINTKNQV